MTGWPTQLPEQFALSTTELLIALVGTVFEPVNLLVMFEVISCNCAERVFNGHGA